MKHLVWHKDFKEIFVLSNLKSFYVHLCFKIYFKARVLEKLPPAPPAPPRKLTDAELMKLKVHEESTLRELRLFLRDIWNKLAKCRKFGIFMRPVDIEDVSKKNFWIRNLLFFFFFFFFFCIW